MSHPRHWTLGAKLTLVGTPFLLLALVSIALTLWVSWQLDGGAAAVNEAGRMRMQSYRLALAVSTDEPQAVADHVREFDGSLSLLRHGDLERPLFVPWDDTVRQRFSVVESNWQRFAARWTTGSPRTSTGCGTTPPNSRRTSMRSSPPSSGTWRAGRRCCTCCRWR